MRRPDRAALAVARPRDVACGRGKRTCHRVHLEFNLIGTGAFTRRSLRVLIAWRRCEKSRSLVRQSAGSSRMS
jgi:hypothetical protein